MKGFTLKSCRRDRQPTAGGFSKILDAPARRSGANAQLLRISDKMSHTVAEDRTGNTPSRRPLADGFALRRWPFAFGVFELGAA
jgi:hypothetical protein